jgi:transcription antitermination factor NusA-like protein
MNEQNIQISSIFSSITGIVPIDIYQDENNIYFLVEDKDKALKKFNDIKKKFENKNIIILNHSDNVDKFVDNFFNNIKILKKERILINNVPTIVIDVSYEDSKKAFGKNHSKFNAGKYFFNKLFKHDIYIRKVNSNDLNR